MEFKDKRDIAVGRDEVWASLLDPAVLKDCIPGCQSLTGSPEEGFDAVVVQKVGPVKATFKGRVIVDDMKPPESCTITGEGKGGPAGFAKGGARIRLAETGGSTVLHYDVEAKVGGKLAQLGGRVIDGFARKMADAFFESFERRVESGAGGGAGEGIPTPAAQAASGVSATGVNAGEPVGSHAVDPSDVAGKASTGAATPPPESRDPAEAEPTGTATPKKGWLGRIMGG